MTRDTISNDLKRDAVKYGHLLTALRHATQEIHALEAEGNLEIEAVLEKLLPVIAKALNAEQSFVAKQLTSEEGGRTWIELIAVHPNKDLAGHELTPSSLIHAIIQTGKPRVIDAPGNDAPQTILGLELFHATSAILVRMQTLDQVYVVGVCNKQDAKGGPFLAGDRMALNSILELIAVGTRSAERRQREHKAIQIIGETATQGDPDALWRIIAQQAAELTKASYATLATIKKNQNHVAPLGTWDAINAQWQPDSWSLPLDDSSISGHVILTKRSHYAPDLRQEAHYRPLATAVKLAVRSALCVPLVIQNEPIGTLYIASTELDGISREDQDFIEQLAPHAAIALQNVHLLTDAQRRLELDEAVIRIQATISDILTTHSRIDQIREGLQPFFDVNGFFLATYQERTKSIQMVVAYDQGQLVEPLQILPTANLADQPDERLRFIDHVLQTREALLVEDCSTWARRTQAETHPPSRIECGLVAPLLHNQQIVGVIGLLGYEKTGIFTEGHLTLLNKIAPHIAIVIGNIQTYEQRVKELEAVSNFQKQISELDSNGLENGERNSEEPTLNLEGRKIESIYQEARRALEDVAIETANLFIVLYDQATGRTQFVLVYERGQLLSAAAKQQDPAYRTRQLGERQDLVEWILRERQPLHLASQQALESFAATHHLIAPTRSRCWLGAPMLLGGDLIGVIALRDLDNENAFSETHEKLLQTIAQQAAIAIQNDRLYARAQDRIRQLSALYKASNVVINKAGQAISEAGLERNAILQAILEQATQATGAFFGTLQEMRGENLEFVAAWPPEQKTHLRELHQVMPLQGRGITVRAIQRNEAQLVGDVTQDEEFIDATGGRTRSELVVVIRPSGVNGKQPFGVINVEHEALGGFDQDDKQLLIALSNLALIAMQNERQAEQLSRTNVIAVMGAWGADIVHDLDRELAAIRFAVAAIRAQPGLPPAKLLERLQEIDTYAKNLVMPSLPEQPLLPGQTVELKNAALIDEVIHAEAEQLRRTHAATTIRVQANAGGIRASIHEQWLRRLLRHLVKNAVKANQAELRPLEIIISTEVQAALVEVSVQDNGRGVRPGIENSLFNRPVPHVGERSDERSGRGLVLVRHIVELHGGSARLKWNKPDQGTCFVFSIPHL